MMPVGKVFDAAANQVLISPVSNFYQGKAIRQQLAAGEKELEQADEKLDLERRQVASQEAAVQQRQDEFRSEVGEKNYKRLTIHAKSVVDSIDSQYQGTSKTPEDQAALLQQNVPLFSDYLDAVSEVSPKRAAEAREILADGVITAEEYQSFRGLVNSAASEFITQDDKDPWSKINPKDFTPESVNKFSQSRNPADLRAVPPKPVVSIDMSGENAATDAYAKTVGERASVRDERAQATFEEDASLARLELALSRGARSGFGESVILDVRGALDTLGMLDFPEGAEESEIVRSIGNKLALTLRNPSSGLGLTGSTSNKDLDFLKASVAGIERSEGGNILLVKMARKMNQFKRDVAAEQARIFAENDGVVPLNLDAQIMKYVNNYEMFTKTERDEIKAMVNKSSNAVSPKDASDETIMEVLGLDKR